MRKQDRIAHEQQSSQEPTKKESQPDMRDRERVKASASEPQRPQRKPGEKLPLPD